MCAHVLASRQENGRSRPIFDTDGAADNVSGKPMLIALLLFYDIVLPHTVAVFLVKRRLSFDIFLSAFAEQLDWQRSLETHASCP